MHRIVLPVALALSLAATACTLPGSDGGLEPTSDLEPLARAPIADTAAGRPSAEVDETLALPSPDPTAAVEVEDTVPASPFETLQPGSFASYELRRGETIAHFARWAELPVATVAEASGVGLLDTLEVGTEVRVPVDEESRARIEQRRTAHHHRRAEGYLASRGGTVGTEFYTVRTGETAWSIANDALGIPVWMLETYNPAVDLDRLRPGQDLMVPVVADTVVDAGEPVE
jgi:hypothetical protein